MTLVFPRHFQRQTHAQLGCLFLKHIQITVQEKKTPKPHSKGNNSLVSSCHLAEDLSEEAVCAP